MQRGFHPRLGARPLRDAIEKHLRGAIAEATLAEIGISTGGIRRLRKRIARAPLSLHMRSLHA